MPNNRKRIPNCWRVKTKLERILIVVLIVNAACITAILIFLATHYQRGATSTTRWLPSITSSVCKTSTCINEAAQILNNIDRNTDPCSDFYAFACKNPTISPQQPLGELLKEEKWQLQLLYNEPIHDFDHQTVKLQKTLYKSCMNKTAAVKNSLRIVTDVLRELGGWPVIVGHQWNEASFNWLNTTYKLRELGYFYSIFLDLQVIPDTVIKDKYMFKIVIPEVHDVSSVFFDSNETNGFMMDVAVALGAELHRALPEMTEILQFLQDLQWLQKRELLPRDKIPRRATVGQFQQEYGKLNWLEFINKIAGPGVKITTKDHVLFPPESILDDWFELLLRTSRRTQANYMLWKIVEEMIPYLTEELHNRGVKPRLIMDEYLESQSQFCVNEIEKRFVPSPLYVMYLRTFLTSEKRRNVQEFMTNIKPELLEMIEKIEWKDDTYKRRATKRVHNMIEIIGAPETYLDDDIFYNVFVKEQDVVSSNNFLYLLSEANKHHWRRLYSLINKSVRDTRPWWNLNKSLTTENYQEEVLISIPANVLQNTIINEKRPNYLNFGKLGITLGTFIPKLLEVPSVNYEDATITEEWSIYLECLVHEIRNSTKYRVVDELFGQLFGLKMAYKVYTNWMKNNNEQRQDTLPFIDYTPNQLFWISSVNLFCYYRTPSYVTELLKTENWELHQAMMSRILNNDQNIRRDFNCPELNIEEENCKIF